MKKRADNIWLHLICSILFLLLPIFSSPDFPNINRIFNNPEGRREVLTHVALIVFFYLCYIVVIPKFYFRKKHAIFFCIIFTFFGLFCLSIIRFRYDPHRLSKYTPQTGLQHLSQDFRPDIHQGKPPQENKLRRIINDYNFFLFIVVFFFAMLLATNKRWHKLQQEKLATELSYLRAQINPHFLFNTLNSIYALAIDKSDHTATAVIKLSGMMRYIVEESQQDFVALGKEINYINEYIALQQFRVDKSVKIQYQSKGELANYVIAPLILITFIENAFKYGVNPEEDSKIDIDINVADDILVLSVSNKKVSTSLQNITSGMGIKNTRNRLNLLYPNRYTLKIDENIHTFKVQLTLHLT